MIELQTLIEFARTKLMGQAILSGVPVEMSAPTNVENAITLRYVNAADVIGVGTFITGSVINFQAVYSVKREALTEADMAIADAINCLHGINGTTSVGVVYNIMRDRPIMFTEIDSGGELWFYIGASFSAKVRRS